MEYHGETEMRTHRRTAKATDTLLTLLAANHAPGKPRDILTERDPPPLTNRVFEDAWNILEGAKLGSRGSVDTIQRAVLAFYPPLTISDLKSERRTDNLVRPRQIAMYLAKNQNRQADRNRSGTCRTYQSYQSHSRRFALDGS